MTEKIARRGSVEFVPLEKMRTREEISQRRLNRSWVAELAQNFCLEQLGFPVVNHVGEWYWIVDGQHRVEALKQWLGEWKGQRVECLVHHGLSEREEANLFDRLNTTKAVSRFDKFRVRLTAGQPEEVNIDAIVRLNQLKISRQRVPGGVSCVGTLLKVYRRGEDCLNRSLHVSYWAFSDAGLESEIIEGIGALVGRYDGQLDDERLTKSLNGLRGGSTTLRQRAEKLRQTYGCSKAHGIAAAAVEVYNRGRGGRKLPGWWKSEAGVAS